MDIPLSNGFNVAYSLALANQLCTNWIPVNAQQPALSQRVLFGTPGIVQIATTGSSGTDANRGSWDLAGIPYYVNGGNLYRLDRSFVSGVETFTTTNLGTISGSGRVSMADNGTQLMVLVPGGKGYIYTTTGGLSEITDPDFSANGNPQHVVYIDGYFACTTDTKKWIVSSLNDGTAWSALDFGSAESDPDPIVAPIVYNNQIYLTGGETTEGSQNIGGSGFPFQRSGLYLDKGCYAPFTLVSTNQMFFMIGGGKNEKAAVLAYQGGQFVKVSNDAVDNVLNGYSDNELNAAFSMAWGDRGQYFVSFSFTDRTLIYNMTTNLWHEAKSSIIDDNGDTQQVRWRVNSLVTAYGYTLVADSQDGRIGRIDPNTYTEYSMSIIRLFSVQPLYNSGKSFRIPKIELTMEAGVGNSVCEKPVISLAISEDGKIYDYERTRYIGSIGKYGQRTIWRKNGRVPKFGIFQFRLSDPVKPVVIKLEVDIK